MINVQSFVYQSELRNHQVVHSEQHTFKCDKCPYTFKAKGELTRHECHYSGKLLHCEIEGCSYTALEVRFLHEHMRGKHSPKNFAYPNKGCFFKTGYRSGLKYHVEKSCKAMKGVWKTQKK